MSAAFMVETKIISNDRQTIDELVRRAREAMKGFADASQNLVDEAVTALAWSTYKPEHAKELAEMAVAETGLGNVHDKILKNQRKTLGTLRDLLRVKTVGLIEDDRAKGIAKYAKPVGVVAAITPSTNPAATPLNKAMMAIKGRNAIIVAPSPSGWKTTRRAIDLARTEIEKVGLSPDLVQVIPLPVTKARTQALMQASDLVVATGSRNSVRSAYSSGTPAIGVGVGNTPVIIDESADLADAAKKICASKIFDNATSCSSENSIVIVGSIYDRAINELKKAGGYLVTPEEHDLIERTLWIGGELNRNLIARDPDVFAREVGLAAEAASAKFFMVEETGIGPDHPLSGEKLSLALTVYRARDFDDAVRLIRDLLNFQGRGHSCGIHTKDMERARVLARKTDVVRVLVNQAHTFGNGGSFDNGLNFTLSMGCGTWGGNSITENLNYRHFINITHLVTTIPEDKPSEEDIFGAYWKSHGR